MKRLALPLAALVIAALFTSVHVPVSSVHAQAAEERALPLQHVADILLPDPPRRFDYQSYDSNRGLLVIAHLAAGKIIVFDTRAKKIKHEITGVSSVHGVLVVPEEQRVYASATGTNEVAVIDENTFEVVARVPGGEYPDGMAYAPEAHKLYVSDLHGRSEIVIDTRTNQRIKTIDLGGPAGNSQYDAVSKHIFVNVQKRNELAEIDAETDEIVGRYRLPGAEGNHGLLIDSPRRLAYVACEGNARLLVVDLASKRVRQTLAVGEDPDVLAFDETLKVLYVAAESGVVAMFRVEDKSLRQLGRRLFAPHAHTVAVDSGTHEVYFPLENVRGQPVLRIERPLKRVAEK